MTYFGFLALFIGVPVLGLAALTWLDYRRGLVLPRRMQNLSPWWVVILHIAIAVIYTTPWDNYLVATRVWWYDPNLVTGIVWGWVPIEEYTFFVVQTIFTGLWLLLLARHLLSPEKFQPNSRLRWGTTLAMGTIWFVSIIILWAGWPPGTYLGLELAWALPPLMLQLTFGADILWRYRRLAAGTIIPATLYLSFADALAIGSGTWTIDPAQSLNIFLPGHLPVEEFIFFLLTNTLLAFGMVLTLAAESKTRLPKRVDCSILLHKIRHQLLAPRLF